VPRRDRDPRPPIEVIGGAPSSESLQEVALGGPGGQQRPGGLRGWRVLGVGVVAAAALAALLTTDGSDDREGSAASSTSSTRPSTTTTAPRPTSSTSPVTLGPLTDEPTGAVALLANQSRRWRVLELDTGELRELVVERPSLDVYSGLVPVRGGVVAAAAGAAWYVPVLGDEDRAAERRLVGEVSTLFPSGRLDRVWVADFPVQVDVPPGGTELRLIDLDGRTRARRRLAQPGWFPATAVGPLVGDGGRAYVVDEHGLRSLGTGLVLGSSATHAVVHGCDDDGRCVPALVDVRTGDRTELSALAGRAGEMSYSSFHLTLDGDVVELQTDAGAVRARWLGPDGSVLAEGRLTGPGTGTRPAGFQGDPAFLPGRQGFLVLGHEGGLYRVRIDGRGLAVDEIPLPTGATVDRVVVVRP
jgi:hypothetical protein